MKGLLEDREVSIGEVITKVMEVFKGREDVFATYWESNGSKGYIPACSNKGKKGICKFPCRECRNQIYIPLKRSDYNLHLHGKKLIGIYPLLPDGTCNFMVIDFDDHAGNGIKNPLEDIKEFIAVCENYDIPVYPERSKSGTGYHAWTFFETPVPAWKVKVVGLALLEESKVINKDFDEKSFDKIFPVQDTLSGKKLGNLIALPFYGEALKQGNSTFLIGEDWHPITTNREILSFLESIERATEAVFDERIEGWNLQREEPKQQIEYIPPDELGSAEGLQAVIEQCEFMNHCRDNQATLSETLWYYLSSILSRFNGGREKFHEFSRGYPGYSEKETDAKFDHAFKASGPITCAKIREDGYPCSKKCKVKSPAGLGAKSKQKPAISLGDITTPQDEVTPFPIDALPECIQELITQGAKANQCQPDLIAVPVLVTLGAAIGNKRYIQVKHGWIFKANIYACEIARAGTGKSPAQNIAVKPLREYQKLLADAYKEEMEEYEDKVAEWERDCARAKKNESIREPKPEEPFMKEVYTSDTTVEALAQSLERNPQGITIVLDELTSWINGLNQYKGGKGSDRECFLSLWSGITTKINRKGKPPVIIDNPFLSVIGGMPPSILHTLMDEKGRGEDGFIHRILFSYPDPVEQQWTEEVISQHILDRYHELFRELHRMTPDHKVITLNWDAYAYWISYYNDLQKEKSSPALPENLHGPWAKMDQQLAKIALILHCVRSIDRETESEQIDLVSMSNAGKIIDYFRSHARRVYSQLTESEEEKQFRQILEWRKKHGKTEITARELVTARLCKNVEEVTILFHLMKKHNIGSINEVKSTGGTTIKFIFES